MKASSLTISKVRLREMRRLIKEFCKMEKIESKTLTRKIHANFKKNDQKLGLSCNQIRSLFVFTFKVAKSKDKFHLSVYTA